MKKTKVEELSLKELIKSKKFDWVNSDITKEKFPPQEISTDFKLFHFDRFLSSKDAIKEMYQEGYRPANIYELLTWKDWNNKDWVVALSSVAEVSGRRSVACLDGSGSGRGLGLGWFNAGWDGSYRFLAVRNLNLKPSESGLLPLELSTSDHNAEIEVLESIITKIRYRGREYKLID